MNIGGLRHRVTIQRSEDYRNENGITKSVWVDKATVWAHMRYISGREYWEAKKYEAESTVEFIIRYNECKDLSVKDKLLHNGIVYNINSIDNVLFKNETLKIKAMAVS